MIRSPEIITEPSAPDPPTVTHTADGMADGVAVDWLDAVAAFVGYWQAVGPRLGDGKARDRAEIEATFDLAFARLRLDGWRCHAHGDGSVAVYVPGRDRPMFTCRWVSVDDPNSGWASRAHDNPSWYSEDGWWGGSDTRMHSPTIDAMLGVYAMQVKNQAAVS